MQNLSKKENCKKKFCKEEETEIDDGIDVGKGSSEWKLTNHHICSENWVLMKAQFFP